MMFCHSCGQRRYEEAQFCSNCGSRYLDVEENVEPARVEEEASIMDTEPGQLSNSGMRSVPKNPSILPWLLPLVCFLFIGIGLVYYAMYEIDINEQVAKTIMQVEIELSEQRYETALKLVSSALDDRSENNELIQLKHVIEKAIAYEGRVDTIDQLIEDSLLDEASKTIYTLKEDLSNENNDLFNPIAAMLEEREDHIMLGYIDEELDKYVTLEELKAQYSKVSSLDTAQAEEIREQIISKITELTSEQAKAYLVKLDFSSAVNMIEQGLHYASNDERLLKLMDEVNQQKIAFEQAEQERLEQAMAAAAEEDMKNRTDAVEILTFDVYLDEWGDVYLNGEIKNVATTQIYSVELYYSVYSLEGYYLGESSVIVYPYYLEPGEIASFDDIFYGAYEDVNVNIENITWYLD